MLQPDANDRWLYVYNLILCNFFIAIHFYGTSQNMTLYRFIRDRISEAVVFLACFCFSFFFIGMINVVVFRAIKIKLFSFNTKRKECFGIMTIHMSLMDHFKWCMCGNVYFECSFDGRSKIKLKNFCACFGESFGFQISR